MPILRVARLGPLTVCNGSANRRATFLRHRLVRDRSNKRNRGSETGRLPACFVMTLKVCR